MLQIILLHYYVDRVRGIRIAVIEIRYDFITFDSPKVLNHAVLLEVTKEV